MVKLSEVPIFPPKILMQGLVGVGKTLLATTVGAKGRIYDLDDGTRGARTFKDSFTSQRSEIDVISLREEDADKALAFERFNARLNSDYSLARSGKFPFSVVIVDGWTTLTEFAMRGVLKTAGRLEKPPQQSDWGAAFRKVEAVLTKLKAMPVAVILIAHLRRYEDNGISKFELACPGTKLPEKVPPYFDEVWNLCITGTGANQKRVIQTSGSVDLPLRTRDQLPNDTSVDLGMPEILKLLNYPLDGVPSNESK